VLLRGKRLSDRWRRADDMTLVETGVTFQVQVGDVATFVGEEAKQRITLEGIRAGRRRSAARVSHGLGARLPRIVV